MRFLVHYTLPDGTEGSYSLKGTEDEIRKQFEPFPLEVAKRGGTDPWVEQLQESSD